ncbi:BppU family phage baseplate upper protein [Mammaliicoccus lentus]|uniref:BppU family phage baseplate upper protein n=1 Tax=Mammaliicoccus lentus TaxID=42858 RepID=UPI000CD20218|nr:BppU family phage baseplate upper protein [Mammaliicoccus lentus]HBV04663.1 phage baseplate upper protein [Staphylococcus sp.]POA03579.1 hypothetical protein CD135_10235 [Mammaliicoccus lentus]QMU10849.1 BppU family phage baseplate upper protein [Mammaliicoccus lentus]WGZ43524.1 BppU family phage baseplate upper protein [Mammaliicoccus lentus]SUM52111.1 phage tail fiber [Mammaliicoccus lentus]
MAIYKNKDIDVSVNVNSADKGNIKANFYTEDKGTASIRIYLHWLNKKLDLNSINMQPQLDLFHSDGSIFMNEKLDIVLAEQGLIQYKITDQVIKHPGTVNAKLFLKNEKESIHVANFHFAIKDSGIEGAISKEININLVEDTVKKIMNESPELFKGEKGDKLTFDDLTPENKEELRGKQGPKGDTLLAPPRIYTRDEYNQLETKDSNTLYFISEV